MYPFQILRKAPHNFHGEHFAIALDGPGTSLTEQLSLPVIIYTAKRSFYRRGHRARIAILNEKLCALCVLCGEFLQ